MSDNPSAEDESTPDSVKDVGSDVYFIQVRGGDKQIFEQMAEQAGEWQMDDNIVIVPEEVKPLNRQEAREYLEEMADALDMEVSESDVE